MTCLSIVQAATLAIGLPRPVAVVGSTDPQVATLLQLAQNTGRDLAAEWPWQKLTVRRTFAGLAQNAQTGEPPADYDRFATMQHIWDVNRRTWLVGPLSPDEWDAVMTDPVATYPSKWCMLGGVINITPAPTIADSFRYTYITKNWVRPYAGTGSTDKEAWTVDTDTALIPERLLEYALIWRWKSAKGLDYVEDQATYEREREKAQARDRGPRTVYITNRPEVPDNFWPGTISY
jgi:hypothetical protein